MSSLLSSRLLALLILLLPQGANWPPANLWASAPPDAPTQPAAAANDRALQQAQAKFEILLAAGLYTRWPAGAFERSTDGSSVLSVGIVGSDSHAEHLDRLARGRTIAGRQVVIKHFRSPAEVKSCQILFIASSLARDERLALLEKYKSSPMLLAGESPGFCVEGGGLNFHVEKGNVKFVLNQSVLNKQQLTIDPRFSRLARAPSPSAPRTSLPAAVPVKPIRPAGQTRPGPSSKPHPGLRDQRPHPNSGPSRAVKPRPEAPPPKAGGRS